MSELAWYQFLLMSARVTSFFVTLPITGYRGVPNILKAFFGIGVAYLLFLTRDFSDLNFETLDEIGFFIMLGGEVLAGLLLGFVVLLFFNIFRMAGQLADVIIGLSLADIFDPQYGDSVTLLGQFYYLFAIAVYFAINGHHHLFMALSQSFDMAPPGSIAVGEATTGILFKFFYHIWQLAFQVAAPVIAASVLTDIALGLISKTVTALQVFMEGLPLKIFLGFAVVYLILPYIAYMMEDIHMQIYIYLINIVESLR